MKNNFCESLINVIKDIYKKDTEISLHSPKFGGNEIDYIKSTIASTFVSTAGEYVDLFEKKIAEFTNSKFGISTSSGTSALHTSLLLSGCDSECEVITQSLSFVATSNAILYCKSEPIFIDVEIDSLGMSPKSLKSFLSKNCEVRDDGLCWNKLSNKKIRACIPMHTYGFPLRIDKIKKICNDYNIILIEDAAESLGTYYKNKHTGSFGLMGTFSFNGNKIITTGGGGMIVTNSESLAREAKHITTTSKLKHKWEFYHDQVGYNYRMPNLNAALGLAQLEQIDLFLKNKTDIAYKYLDWAKKNDFHILEPIKDGVANYWINILITRTIEEKKLILEETNRIGINTRPAWNLIHTFPMFKHCQTDDLKNTKWLAKRIINLPSGVNY